MTQGYLGTDLNDDRLQSGTPQAQPPADPNGPPPTQEDPHLKGKPHHLESRIAQLEPEMRELFEKTMADKVNNDRKAKEASERLAKTEQKLNEIAAREAAAETKRLEEAGEFKKLAEQANARATELEAKLFKVEVHSKLDRELMSAGALDTETATEYLLSRYSDELRANPDSASDLVKRFQEAKPLLFKVATPDVQAPVIASGNQPVRSTSSQVQSPTSSTNPSQFNATDKKIPMNEVEKMWKEATKNVDWSF